MHKKVTRKPTREEKTKLEERIKHVDTELTSIKKLYEGTALEKERFAVLFGVLLGNAYILAKAFLLMERVILVFDFLGTTEAMLGQHYDRIEKQLPNAPQRTGLWDQLDLVRKGMEKAVKAIPGFLELPASTLLTKELTIPKDLQEFDAEGAMRRIGKVWDPFFKLHEQTQQDDKGSS